jgi:Zn ribbon nucleic-acid-binding protein
MDDFRFPDGVEFLGESGSEAHFTVSMPSDEDGHIGRQCPQCAQHFRIAIDDYDGLPEDVRLWCVYCGYSDDHSEFTTEQQQERAVRAAQDYASQLIGQMLDESFGKMARSTRRNEFVQVTYRSSPFFPDPLPGIDEERLIRERVCGTCRLHYAVYGEHRYCPVCGPLPALTVALDALSADRTRLEVLHQLPNDTLRTLRETGVLDRTYADTVENVVGAVEALAERTFHALVPDADQVVRGKGKVFQRLNDFADLYQEHAGVDLRAVMGSRWPELESAWAARHIFTHSDGVVDARYLRTVSGSALREGQRLRATAELAGTAIDNAEELCRVLSVAPKA